MTEDKCKDCIQFKALKETTDRHTNDIRKIFEDIKDMAINQGMKDEKLGYTEKILTQIGKSLESIETKLDSQIDKITDNIKVELEKRDLRIIALEMVPAKKWERISIQVVASLVTTLFGFIAGKFFK